MEIDPVYANRCVWDYVTPVALGLYRLYKLYKSGYLFNGVSIDEQPRQYIDAMLYIENIYNQCKYEAEKRALDK